MHNETVAGGEFKFRCETGIRVLLICPPAYDFRLEWYQWHQPTGLLQLASWLLNERKDVRLIDCLFTEHGKRLSRRKIGTVPIGGYNFHKWHFGMPFEKLEARVKDLLKEGWEPDKVFVTSLNSIWWESARDTIARLRKILPDAQFVLGGAYPTVEPEHAARHSGADIIVTGSVPEAAKLSPDLSLYQVIPYSAGIYFYANPSVYKPSTALRPRAVSKILKEIKDKARLGVREFVFFDEELRIEDQEAFSTLLDKIAKAELDVHFVLPGNISPRTITQDLAQKMRRAKITQVYLQCELYFGLDNTSYATSLSEYERCVNALLKKGGFRPREGNLAAMLVVGLPYENLAEVNERLIHLAHIVGSVILVPFQYVPGLHKGTLFERALAQNGSFTPDKFNSKLYPLATLSGKKLEEYIELTRLASLLNSKYRSKTFDFLGGSLAANMFRESIRTEGWNPLPNKPSEDEEITAGTVDLPVVQ